MRGEEVFTCRRLAVSQKTTCFDWRWRCVSDTWAGTAGSSSMLFLFSFLILQFNMCLFIWSLFSGSDSENIGKMWLFVVRKERCDYLYYYEGGLHERIWVQTNKWSDIWVQIWIWPIHFLGLRKVSGNNLEHFGFRCLDWRWPYNTYICKRFSLGGLGMLKVVIWWEGGIETRMLDSRTNVFN